jgi:hypothetical protein
MDDSAATASRAALQVLTERKETIHPSDNIIFSIIYKKIFSDKQKERKLELPSKL